MNTVYNTFFPKSNTQDTGFQYSWINPSKIAAFVLSMLSITAPIASASPAAICDEEGLCRSLQGRVTFPSYMERGIYTGVIMTEDGERTCTIGKEIPKFEHCDLFSSVVEMMSRAQDPEMYEISSAEPLAVRDKGAWAQPIPGLKTGNEELDAVLAKGKGISQVNYLLNPKMMRNHKTVLGFLETTILQDPQYFEKSEESILKDLKTINGMYFKNNVPENKGIKPGVYRKSPIIVTEEKAESSFEELFKIAKKNGADNKSTTFKSMKMKAKKYKYNFDNLSYWIKDLNDKEKEFFRRYIGHLGTDPELLESEMEAFAREFKGYGQAVRDGSMDAIEAAAIIHQNFGYIHPFFDHNGKEARALMNTLLMIGGYQPVIFKNDDAYTRAIQEDQQYHNKAFEAHLRDTINWNQKQKNLQV